MLIAFSCRKCGQAYKVAASQAGKRGRCKQCGGELTVPAAGADTEALDLFGPDENGPGPESESGSETAAAPAAAIGGTGGGARRGLLLWLVGLAGVAVGGVVATVTIILGISGPLQVAQEKPPKTRTVQQKPRNSPPAGREAYPLALRRELLRDGAFGFPQAQAQILCDWSDLRVSVWNNREYLYVQAIVWVDSENTQGKPGARPVAARLSSLFLDVNADRKPTPQVDRHYVVRPGSGPRGLKYFEPFPGMSKKVIQQDSQGRGAINYRDAREGWRVRVDSFVIPLAEIHKQPGERIRLCYSTSTPRVLLNSLGPERETDFEMFPEILLSDRAAALDLAQLPEGREGRGDTPKGLAGSGREAGSGKAGAGSVAAGTSPPPRLPAAVESLLSDLREAGQGQLAAELTQEINQAHEVVRFRKTNPQAGGHVIVGRVLGEEWDDPSRVVAQMRIHGEGYFVSSVGASGRPIGFRKQGYLPAEITPTGQPGSVEYVGEVRLGPLPEAMGSEVRGKIVLDGESPATTARAWLSMMVDPINTPSGGSGIYTSDTVNVAVSGSGEFSASGLSPGRYSLQVVAPGHVFQHRFVTLEPGETHGAGTVALERARQITISYRVAPSPPFSQARLERQTAHGGGQFRANPQDPRIDLMFPQNHGEIRCQGMYMSSIADLGPGKFDDFLEIDPKSARFIDSPSSIMAQPGHVYLLDQKSLKHWVLFELQFDDKPPG
jgi:hypothetical protein